MLTGVSRAAANRPMAVQHVSRHWWSLLPYGSDSGNDVSVLD